jgi:hypothetical protein
MVDNLAITGTASFPLTLNSTTSDMTSGTYNLGEMPTPNDNQYCVDLDTNDFPNKCGNYYSWTDATTGSTLTSGNAPNSICPKNWKLPTGSSSGEYATLQSVFGWLNGGEVNASAWRGLFAGQDGGNVGNAGMYWTSTASVDKVAYYMVYSSTINAGYSNLMTLKNSVRCLTR